jgi:hypothetical protein
LDRNGEFEPGRTFDIVLIEDGPGARGSFMTCSLSIPASGPDAAPRLLCSSSAVRHAEFGNLIQILEHVGDLTVVVSSAGAELGRQSLQPEYTTTDNGSGGCGTCASAAVHVTVP